MDEEDEKVADYALVPPDGGWGWLVLFGATLINLLVPGIIKSFGVLFVEFLETFKFSEMSASWIPALSYFLYCSLGPLASYLSTKSSYRTVTLIGGAFASLGMILSCFASSFIHLCVTYGLLFGIGAGLSFPPGIFIVTSYFQKYRGFANGVAISGSALGSMILPPLLRYLLQNYGLNGAVLILGAITMNVWVGALLYHPVSWHLKRVPISTTNIKPETIVNDITDQVQSGDTIYQQSQGTNKISLNGDLISKPGETLLLYNSTTKKVIIRFTPSTSAAAVYTECSSENSSRRGLSRAPSIVSLMHHGHSITSWDSTLGRMYPEYTSQVTIRSISETMNLCSCCCFYYYPQQQRRKVSQEYQVARHAHALSKSRTDIEAKKTTATLDDAHTQSKDQQTGSRVVTLFRNPLFIIILLSNASTAIGYTNFTIFLPAYAKSLNHNKILASYLLSVTAFFDLIGRIGGSTVSDILSLPKRYYFITGLMVSGITLILLPIACSYTMLCVACAIFGVSSGTYTGITVVTMVEMLGEDKLADAYTISLFVNGCLQLIGPPACGVVYETYKSYTPIISALGVIVTVVAVICMFLPTFLSTSRRKHELHNVS